MVTILNQTPRPLRVRLPGNKTLHLAPFGSAKITDQAADLPSLLRQVQAGAIAILGRHEDGHVAEAYHHEIHESTHGHPQPTVVMPKGNR